MLDAHCHIDLYPDPSRIAVDAESAGVFTVCVTNLPSAFEAAYPHIQRFKKVRLALGLHPLRADAHTEEELARFTTLVGETSFIGEVGLDFSRDGVATRDRQLASFRFVLRSLKGEPKFVTIHSRQAEVSVLELLAEEYRQPVVFHWYTGTQKNLDLAIEQGHFFSINPAMTWSKKGKSIIARIPPDRTLTESDGPFIKVGARTIVPADIQLVEDALAEVWGTDPSAVRTGVADNFRRLMGPLRRPKE
ncbi:MAG: Qat anti-phage system TatD family nuclease QatD [Candidatus Acidiferrales bacterium]|jgi:TatD DNase family protein